MHIISTTAHYQSYLEQVNGDVARLAYYGRTSVHQQRRNTFLAPVGIAERCMRPSHSALAGPGGRCDLLHAVSACLCANGQPLIITYDVSALISFDAISIPQPHALPRQPGQRHDPGERVRFAWRSRFSLASSALKLGVFAAAHTDLLLTGRRSSRCRPPITVAGRSLWASVVGSSVFDAHFVGKTTVGAGGWRPRLGSLVVALMMRDTPRRQEVQKFSRCVSWFCTFSRLVNMIVLAALSMILHTLTVFVL